MTTLEETGKDMEVLSLGRYATLISTTLIPLQAILDCIETLFGNDNAANGILSTDDFGAICNCAVRYAIGRQSYMPGNKASSKAFLRYLHRGAR